MGQRASDFHILLDNVAITHLNFSPEYEKAVESKQVSQQQAERARYLVLKAQEERKRTIIHAEGERQSAQMIGNAIQANPGFIELRRIQVAMNNLKKPKGKAKSKGKGKGGGGAKGRGRGSAQAAKDDGSDSDVMGSDSSN